MPRAADASSAGNGKGRIRNRRPQPAEDAEPKHQIAAQVQTYTGYTIQKVFGRETGHDEAVSLVRAYARSVSRDHPGIPERCGSGFDFIGPRCRTR
jgi:hypothetical protein